MCAKRLSEGQESNVTAHSTLSLPTPSSSQRTSIATNNGGRSGDEHVSSLVDREKHAVSVCQETESAVESLLMLPR